MELRAGGSNSMWNYKRSGISRGDEQKNNINYPDALFFGLGISNIKFLVLDTIFHEKYPSSHNLVLKQMYLRISKLKIKKFCQEIV